MADSLEKSAPIINNRDVLLLVTVVVHNQCLSSIGSITGTKANSSPPGQAPQVGYGTRGGGEGGLQPL